MTSMTLGLSMLIPYISIATKMVYSIFLSLGIIKVLVIKNLSYFDITK